MAHRPRRAGLRTKVAALAVVLLLAGSQVAGCVSRDAGGDANAPGQSARTEALIAAAAILSVLLAGAAASSEGGGE